MAQFRKRPVIVDAVQWNKPGDDAAVVPAYITGDAEVSLALPTTHMLRLTARETFAIASDEGLHEVNPGDWLITGVAGERYPCRADVFERTYVPADAPLEGIPDAVLELLRSALVNVGNVRLLGPLGLKVVALQIGTALEALGEPAESVRSLKVLAGAAS